MTLVRLSRKIHLFFNNLNLYFSIFLGRHQKGDLPQLCDPPIKGLNQNR